MSDIEYPYYHSYLLRIWQESEQSLWRGSLQSVEDGKTVVFGDMDSLLLFLLNRTDQAHEPFVPPSTDDGISS